jgi:hypothetical protein
MKLLGTISVDFDAKDELLIRFSAFVRYWRKKWKYSLMVHELFIDFKKVYDVMWRELVHNILIEFGIPMKLVRLIKMCLNEPYNRVNISKHLPGGFLIQNVLKEGEALTLLLFNVALVYATK